jgi:hypothetical protein
VLENAEKAASSLADQQVSLQSAGPVVFEIDTCIALGHFNMWGPSCQNWAARVYLKK